MLLCGVFLYVDALTYMYYLNLIGLDLVCLESIAKGIQATGRENIICTEKMKTRNWFPKSFASDRMIHRDRINRIHWNIKGKNFRFYDGIL